jgi:hypothetical protein
MRIREVSDRVPKPMVRIGDRPILLHVMKYYAHFGHTEFILCLGYQGHVIKEYWTQLVCHAAVDESRLTIWRRQSFLEAASRRCIDSGLTSFTARQTLHAMRSESAAAAAI